MSLPFSEKLPISKLASAFNNTSATYKFYWLIAIVEAVEEDRLNLDKKELFARIISNAWYTVNYFHISFGQQDIIQQAVNTIIITEKIAIDTAKNNILKQLFESQNPITVKSLNHFNKNVPHWFLSPWFPKINTENDTQYRKRIYSESKTFVNHSLYALFDDQIKINPEWVSYIKQNGRILKDFCYWNLSLFLQTRNPNVPNIQGKLIKPAVRNSLIKQRKNYWDIIFSELGTIDCIYTNKKLHIDKYALDHFVPYAFVTHDLIWNLVPIDTQYNSFKSDKLPELEKHYDRFFKIQKIGFEIINHHQPKNRFLEEYTSIFPLMDNTIRFDYTRHKEIIQPLITIAHNNGFQYI
jgi:hypothetical protein